MKFVIILLIIVYFIDLTSDRLIDPMSNWHCQYPSHNLWFLTEKPFPPTLIVAFFLWNAFFIFSSSNNSFSFWPFSAPNWIAVIAFGALKFKFIHYSLQWYHSRFDNRPHCIHSNAFSVKLIYRNFVHSKVLCMNHGSPTDQGNMFKTFWSTILLLSGT